MRFRDEIVNKLHRLCATPVASFNDVRRVWRTSKQDPQLAPFLRLDVDAVIDYGCYADNGIFDNGVSTFGQFLKEADDGMESDGDWPMQRVMWMDAIRFAKPIETFRDYAWYMECAVKTRGLNEEHEWYDEWFTPKEMLA